MKTFLSFVLKETKHILRDKRTMLILFGMPVMLMLLFGFAITTDVKNVRTVVVTSYQSPQTQAAIERLAQSEYFTITRTVATPQEAERLIRNQKADMGLIPSPQGGGGNSLQWQIMVDGCDPNMAQQWTTYAQSILSQPIDAKHYSFPSPVRPLMVIIAKAVPYLVLAFAILITILLMAHYVLAVPLAGSLFWILVVSTIYIILALSLGLLISNIAKTQLVALLLSAMVLLMPVVMLSGMMFPVESMPVVLQWISAVVPPRYYIEAMRKLMIMGVGIGEVAKEVIILTVMTLLLLAVALKKFNVRLE